ncbi:MAG: GTPase Era [Pseudomonadota bacterium]
MTRDDRTRFGTVALVGRPNVGKSTLLNRLVGERVSITAHRPQTTRHAVRGIATWGEVQAVFVDTPGIHGGGNRVLNRVLNRTARGSLSDVDLIVMLVQAPVFEADDQLALDAALRSGPPVILAVNKIDRVNNKSALLPYLQSLPRVAELAEVVPVSARNGDGIEALKACLIARLPEGEHAYEADALTDKSERFLAAELIREQLTRQLNEELPYAITVQIEQFDASPSGYRILAAIWVERESQKGIVIGRQGSKLKAVGTRARARMSELFGVPVHLEQRVLVRRDWSDDHDALQSLGISD